MTRKVALFRINSMENTSQLTPEICYINADQGIETTVHLDLNIISAIRKFTFYENSLNPDICNLVNSIISIFSQLDRVYISPGFAFHETSSTYTKRNIQAFNYFLKEYLPKYHDAYNAVEYQPNTSKEDKFYLFNAHASIYAIHYIRKKYNAKSPFYQFKKYLSMIDQNLKYLDPVVCMVAIYAFAESDCINQNIKHVIKNFVKKYKLIF